MSTSVVVTTGSRIHFGLCPLANLNPARNSDSLPTVGENGPASVHKFGGLGVAIDSPGHQIEFAAAEQLEVSCHNNARALQSVQAWFSNVDLALTGSNNNFRSLPVRIFAKSKIPIHQGLGSGTQFDLSIACGLSEFFGLKHFDAFRFGRILNRGNRSLVGTAVFAKGGLIWDPGVPRDNGTPQQSEGDNGIVRIKLPSKWRMLTITPLDSVGLNGQSETASFDNLAEFDERLSKHLLHLANQVVVPAARNGEFLAFANGIREFGILAGRCFESVQGGTYNGTQTTETVTMLQELGAFGVGQSSWGPCVFSWFEDLESANAFLAENRHRFGEQTKMEIRRPINHGAEVMSLQLNSNQINELGNSKRCQNLE